MKFLEMLKIKNESENFRYDKCLENLRKIKILAKVFLLYLLLLISLLLVSINKEGMDILKYLPFILAYGFFAILNIFSYFISVKAIYLITLNRKKVKVFEAYIIFYITAVLMFGTFISLMDQADYGHLMVFMIFSLVCTCYFNTNYQQIILPFSVAVIALAVGLYQVQTDKDVLIGHYYNLSLFIPLTYIISRIIYKDYKAKYHSIEMLEKEMELNKLLNKELEQANHILNKLASVDTLTGISNRRGLNHYLDISVENCCAQGASFTSILIDIDNFKEFNDNYGHCKGDEVLIKVAEKLSDIAKKALGFSARWGGEEFILVVCGASADEIKKICDEILSEILKLKIIHEFSKVSDYITVSAGACTMNIKSKIDIDACIECTDKALYYAKQSGRNNFKTFNFTKQED